MTRVHGKPNKERETIKYEKSKQHNITTLVALRFALALGAERIETQGRKDTQNVLSQSACRTGSA